MSYIVVYQRADGSSGLEECESLDTAVVAAERLRNVDAVEHPRILKTEEVKFDFRPYYRVEVSDESVESPAPTSSFAAPPAVEEAELPPPPVDETEAASHAETVVEAAPPVPSGSDEVGEEAVDSAPIDPWAAAEGDPIDYSLSEDAAVADGGAPTPEGADRPAVEPEVEPEDMGSPARGLFSTHSLPDPPKDPDAAGQLAEDVSDAVPPRRGLFGR